MKSRDTKDVWERLLSPERERKSSVKPAPQHKYSSEFASDIVRVVTSSAFRRLKDKTQVFPLEEHDFVRTRLTHSLEVAAVGDQLTANVMAFMEKDGALSKAPSGAIRDVVHAACLLHDLGNPPFGHAGERAIQRAVRGLPEVGSSADGPWSDYAFFDGNAQTFRIVTRLAGNGLSGGLNLTYATLATLGKYPWTSADRPDPKKAKAGCLTSERTFFEQVREATGLKPRTRHPLTYLVEAADDIAYCLADAEDGHKKGAFRLDHLIDSLQSSLSGSDQGVESLLKTLSERRDELKGAGYPPAEAEQLALQHFRAVAAGHLVGACAKLFQTWLAVEEFSPPVGKTGMPTSLTDQCELGPLLKAIKDFEAKHVYSAPVVLIREQAGQKVIGDLFALLRSEEKLRTALCRQRPNTDTSFRPMEGSDLYRTVQEIIDFICGMTDSFAIELHHKLVGTSL